MKTDPNTLRFNQVCIVCIASLALIAQMPWVIGALAAIMLAGSAQPRLALFKVVWERGVRHALGVKPQPVDDDPRAHNFAQTVGGIFLLTAFSAYLLGAAALGNILTLTVIGLALLNLTTRVCVGCLMYHRWRLMRWQLAQQRR